MPGPGLNWQGYPQYPNTVAWGSPIVQNPTEQEVSGLPDGGIDRVINTLQSIPASISRAAGFPIPIGSATSTTLAVPAWVGVGDLAIMAVFPINSTNTVTSISSPNTTGWTKVTTWGTGTRYYELWTGVVTAVGADTVTFAWSVTPANFAAFVDELTGGNVWSSVASGSIAISTAAFSYPSLTSGTAPVQAYWGYADNLAPNTSFGNTPGFQYANPNLTRLVTFNGTLAPSTVYQPNGNQASASANNAGAMIVSAATVAVVQQGSVVATLNQPTLTGVFASMCQAGNKIVVLVTTDNAATSMVATGTGGGAFTKQITASAFVDSYVYDKTSDGTEIGCTFTDTGNSGKILYWFELSGVNPALDQVNFATPAQSVNLAVGSVTPTGTDVIMWLIGMDNAIGGFDTTSVGTLDAGLVSTETTNNKVSAGIGHVISSAVTAPTVHNSNNPANTGGVIVAYRPAVATVAGAVAMSGSSGMTVDTSVTEVASVTLAGTAGMTVDTSVTEVAGVALSGTAGMTIGALVTEVAGVALAATAGMTVAASVTEVAVVSLSGVAALTVPSLVTEVAAVAMAATAGISVNTTVTEVATVAMVAASTLTAAGVVTRLGAVALAGAAGLTVAVSVIEVAAVSLSGTAGLTVTASLGVVVSLAASSSLTVAASVSESAAVALTAAAGLAVAGVAVTSGSVTMTALAGLSVAGMTLEVGVLLLAANTSLTVETGAKVAAVVLLVALSQMVLVGGVQPTGTLFPVTSPLPVSEGQVWPPRYLGA